MLDDDAKRLIEGLADELKSIRAGRATPALVEHIMVEAYGTRMPMNGVAAISVSGAEVINIEPWDASLIGAIEKAIEQSALGLRPIAEQHRIRLNLPPLTQERRQELLKAVNERIEDVKVRLRKIREAERERLTREERAKTISEDEKFRQLKKLDEKMDDWQERVEEIRKRKEQQILSN